MNQKEVIAPGGNNQFQLNGGTFFSIANGIHNQMHPLQVYFVKSKEGSLFNVNLNFTSA
jgi:hypothetical protein